MVADTPGYSAIRLACEHSFHRVRARAHIAPGAGKSYKTDYYSLLRYIHILSSIQKIEDTEGAKVQAADAGTIVRQRAQRIVMLRLLSDGAIVWTKVTGGHGRPPHARRSLKFNPAESHKNNLEDTK